MLANFKIKFIKQFFWLRNRKNFLSHNILHLSRLHCLIDAYIPTQLKYNSNPWLFISFEHLFIIQRSGEKKTKAPSEQLVHFSITFQSFLCFSTKSNCKICVFAAVINKIYTKEKQYWALWFWRNTKVSLSVLKFNYNCATSRCVK